MIWPTIEGKINQSVLFKTHVKISMTFLNCYRFSKRDKKLVIKSPDLTIEVTEVVKKNMTKKEFEVRKIIDIKVE
jgi:hypothetical protein